jgi:hypothetical protein
MERTDRFLVTLYLKSKRNPSKGYNPGAIGKLLEIPSSDLHAIQYELAEKRLIRTDQGYGDSIVIAGEGIDSARALLIQTNVTIISFTSAVYTPPASRMEYAITYYLQVIIPNVSEANYSITVSVSDIVAQTWGLSFEKGGTGEKLLLLYARDRIAEKVLAGTLDQHEQLDIMMRDLANLPKYNPTDAVTTAEALYIIDRPEIQSPLTAEGHSAEQIVKTRKAINILFKKQYGEELFLPIQEENAGDLYRHANNAADFAVRSQSLGTIVGQMNNDLLRNLTGNKNEEVKSIGLLKQFLGESTADTAEIIKIFRELIHVRNGYPAHTDNMDALKAHHYFGLSFPVVDYSRSWKGLLSHYLKALQKLNEFLLQKIMPSK